MLVREGNGTPLQYSCLENLMDGGAWWTAVHGVAKSQTRLSDFTFTFHFHALEKEMATHSSILAWRIPGIGGAWWAAIYGIAQSRTRLKRLSSSSKGMHWSQQTPSSNNTREDSTDGHYQMVNNEIIFIIFTAAKDGEALYCQQKRDWELAQIMNSLK